MRDSNFHNNLSLPDIPVRIALLLKGFNKFIVRTKRAFGDATFEEKAAKRGCVQRYH